MKRRTGTVSPTTDLPVNRAILIAVDATGCLKHETVVCRFPNYLKF